MMGLAGRPQAFSSSLWFIRVATERVNSEDGRNETGVLGKHHSVLVGTEGRILVGVV